jgi:hypothetical protein
MSRSADTGTGAADGAQPMPPALRSLGRTIRFGYRAEPRLLLASFAVTVVTAIPDVLVALWLKLLADGVADGPEAGRRSSSQRSASASPPSALVHDAARSAGRASLP